MRGEALLLALVCILSTTVHDARAQTTDIGLAIGASFVSQEEFYGTIGNPFTLATGVSLSRTISPKLSIRSDVWTHFGNVVDWEASESVRGDPPQDLLWAYTLQAVYEVWPESRGSSRTDIAIGVGVFDWSDDLRPESAFAPELGFVASIALEAGRTHWFGIELAASFQAYPSGRIIVFTAAPVVTF